MSLRQPGKGWKTMLEEISGKMGNNNKHFFSYPIVIIFQIF